MTPILKTTKCTAVSGCWNMPSVLSQSEAEAILSAHWIVWAEDLPNGVTWYVSNQYPGADILLDWSKGYITKEDFRDALAGESIKLP